MTSTAKAWGCPTRTARQRQVWGKAAPGYDKQIAFFEKIQFAGGREWLGARARGRVLEVAIGTGRSLPHYPADASITGIEPSPAMVAIAGQHAAGLGRDIDLREGDAEHLPAQGRDRRAHPRRQARLNQRHRHADRRRSPGKTTTSRRRPRPAPASCGAGSGRVQGDGPAHAIPADAWGLASRARCAPPVGCARVSFSRSAA